MSNLDRQQVPCSEPGCGRAVIVPLRRGGPVEGDDDLWPCRECCRDVSPASARNWRALEVRLYLKWVGRR